MQIDGYIRGFGITYDRFDPLPRNERHAVSSGRKPEYSPVYGDADQYRYQMEFYGVGKMG